MATIKLLLAAGLTACAVGHLTHVCTMTTPGTSSETCGSFVLWLGTYHSPPTAGNLVPGKAVVQLGQTIYPDSPFTFSIGSSSAGTFDPFCAYNAIPASATFGQVRDHLTSSAFRSACPVGVQPHISDQTVVKCFDNSGLVDDGTPNLITDPNSRGGCDVGGPYNGQQPQVWYYIELEADSSADLLVSLDGVDANLAAQLGACSLGTGSTLGRDELFSGRVRIPAEVLDIPSCGGGCAAAFPVPPNAASVSNCDANTPSGRNCAITCQAGFQLVGGSTRCDNGAYVGTSVCTDQTTCSQADAASTISGLVGLTGSGCGVDTAEGSVCFFNCGVGFFSVGTLTCDPSLNQWTPSDDAICLPGNGSGVGDPEIVLPDGDCLGGTPETSSDYSANVIPGPNLFTLAISGSNFDPQADFIAVIERGDCENPSCSQAAGLLADQLIPCDQPGSTQNHLVCGDGISTGLPIQDDLNSLGKICFCDGSSRGGCRSVGDFNTEGPVIGGLNDGCVQNLTSIDIDFNSGVDAFGRSHGNLEFHGPSGFTVIFTDDDSTAGGTDAANGVEITNQNAGNIHAGSSTNFVLGSRNQPQPDGTNAHTSGIIARFNHGARVVSFDDTDDDGTLKALFAFDEFGTLIGQSPFASQVPVIVNSDTHCNGNLIYAVEFDTLAGVAGGANDGVVFTIDNFHAEGVDSCTAVTFQPSPAPTAPTAAPTTAAPTRGPGTRTCYATGDPHYKTFDDMYYDHFGQCDYMLTADCRQNGTQFQVQVRNDNPGRAVVTNVVAVAVRMPNGDVIELTSGGHSIMPAGSNTSSAFALPASGGDGTMYPWVAALSGTRKSVRVPALGVEVLWDGTGGVPRNSVQVLLEPTSVLLNGTCGLCGDADGNATNDNDMVPEHDYWNTNRNSSRRSRRQTGTDRVTGSITCDSSVTVTVAGDNDFHPFLLDLSGRPGNTVVNLQTCNSLVSDPDLCLGSEYIDDDQFATSNAGGDCATRFNAGHRVGLAEDVTYSLAPGIYPIQIGTYSGTGDVTLELTCTDASGSPATSLRDNSDRCFGVRSALTQSPSPPPTVLSVSTPTPSPTVGIDIGPLFFRPDPLDGDVCVTGPPVVCVCDDPVAPEFCSYLRPGGEYSHCPGYSPAVYDSCVCDFCFDPEEARNIIRIFDDVCRPLVGSLVTLSPTPGPTASPTAPTIAPSTTEPTSLPTTAAPTHEPTRTPTTSEPSSSPTVSTTATSTQTTTPYQGFVECRTYHGWWYLAVSEDQNCAMQIELLDQVAQICNSVSGISDVVRPLVCTPSGFSYFFLQATDATSPLVCNQTVNPLNHAMARFSRFFAGEDRSVSCETDNVINHDTYDLAGCQGTADVLNAMIESYGRGDFALCEVSTITTSQTTTQTTTGTTGVPTAMPSGSPTSDPCLVHRCSGDCEGFVLAEPTDRRFFCGWDSTTNLCVTGEISDAAEIMALLESSPGDCNHLTLAPTTIPTPAPTAVPTTVPTVFPTDLPTLGPTPEPTSQPTVLPTFQPTVFPSNGPSASPTPAPTRGPTLTPTPNPTRQPTSGPTALPTVKPTALPTRSPTNQPTISPTSGPTAGPTVDICGQHQCSVDCEGPGTGGIGCGWDSVTERCRTGFVTLPAEADAMLEAVPGACSGYTEAPSTSPTALPTSLPTEDPCRQIHCSRDCGATGTDGVTCGWDIGTEHAPGFCRTGFVTTPAESDALLETVRGACSRYSEAPSSIPTGQPTLSPTSLINMLDTAIHQQELEADETGAYCFFPEEDQGIPLAGTLPMLPLQFSIRLEVELQAESGATLFAKVSEDGLIFAVHVINSACGDLCTRGGLRIDYMAQRNSEQQSLAIADLHLNDGDYHVLEISVNVDTMILRVDEGNHAVRSDYEFQLNGPIDDCDATDGSCRAFVAMAVDGPPIDGCIMAAALTYCNECWPALATLRPTLMPTDAPSTPAPTALTCPRNCGDPERGGGTCRPNGRCTSCNSNRLRVNGRCVLSLSCIGRAIQTGSMTGQGCGCIDRTCHSCTRTVTGDVCRRCRDSSYLLDDACVTSCPATLASSGISLFGRRCLEPFTCRGGQVQNMDVNFGCKCAADGNLPGASCHECEHRAGGYGEICTRCNGGRYLYDSACLESCAGLEGLISYNPGSYGRECRAPFTCNDRVDGDGRDCKCPRSVGKNDCHSCTIQPEGDFCLVCDNGKYLYQGRCIDRCPIQRGSCASGTETTGRQCVRCE